MILAIETKDDVYVSDYRAIQRKGMIFTVFDRGIIYHVDASRVVSMAYLTAEGIKAERYD
ncbi:hypothetical protein [Weissella tructae]|uniref:hypothetical protein n=1 Tax=Weissella tructae TaxID=887702 RepID=UPI001BDC5922|nr:hypothetical protein [Weissella tructae]QVV90839.1 hypothetical protein KHQ32_04185 [Weissella tructae]